MILIETFLNGKLHRQHWHALCNTEDEAAAKIEDMKARHTQNDGSYPWTHSTREVTLEEISSRTRHVYLAPTQKQKAEYAAEIENWQAECLRIGWKK